jgi:hypothetical protein
MCKEAEHVQPVVDGDDDHVFLGKVATVIVRLRSRANVIAPAMDPNHDRQLVAR